MLLILIFLAAFAIAILWWKLRKRSWLDAAHRATVFAIGMTLLALIIVIAYSYFDGKSPV